MDAAGDEGAAEVGPRRSEEVTRLRGTTAALLGWVVVGLANAVGLFGVPLRSGGAGERLLHHVYDFGHVLALGLAALGATFAVARFGPKRPMLRLVVLAAGAVLAAEGLLAEDLGGAAERFSGSDAAWAVRVLCAVVALSVPVAALASRLPRALPFRLGPLVLGLVLVGVNEHVLVNGYPALHTWLAVTGATLLGASTSELPLGRPLAVASTWLTPRRARVALGVLGAWALVTLVVPPPSGVELAMLERDTAFLAAPLTELHAPRATGKTKVPRELEPWFTPRAGRKDVPPSSPGVLPAGGIVIVVTIDALRADALAPRQKKRLPNFSDMMKHGVTFTEARSFGSGTRVSLAALLTGRYHSQLRWTHPESLRATLEGDRLPRLPELLRPHGVRTASAVTLANSLEPTIGIVKGFEESKLIPDHGALKGTPEIVEHLLEQLKRQGKGSLFYYTHLLDPHFPYYRYRDGPKGAEASYRQEIEYVDGFIGRIRQGIRELGLAGRTLLVVSSDHGEGFGEHGLRGHNKVLYEVMVRVPLLVEGPGLEPRTVTTPVSMMDIGPTVLDVLGVPTPGYFMGESLVPFLRGGEGRKHRPIYMGAAFAEALLFPDAVKVILRDKPRTEEVYDLRKDPKEESNLRDTPEGAERAALARAYAAAHRWPNGKAPRALR